MLPRTETAHHTVALLHPRGHYIGLYQFGKEAAQAKGLVLYCTALVAAFFAQNEPWKYFVSLGIFQLEVIQPGQIVQLAPGLAITPRLVPHRSV